MLGLIELRVYDTLDANSFDSLGLMVRGYCFLDSFVHVCVRNMNSEGCHFPVFVHVYCIHYTSFHADSFRVATRCGIRSLLS